MNKELTVIIGAYNEEEGIRNTIEELLPLIKEKTWELLVVNDGSVDRTGEILESFNDIKIVNHASNRGYGAALKTGILNAQTPNIAFYDADGQHRPEDLLKLWENHKNYDMVVGKRGKDSHVEWVRKPGKWVLGRVANFLVGEKIPDLNSGLRIIKKDEIVRLLHLFPDGFSFSTTSTVAFMNMNKSVLYYPIKVRKRVGKSTVKQLKHGSNTLLLILRLIVLFNPLKVFLPVSFALIILGIIYEVFYGIILITGLSLIPGALLLIIAGLIIFFFGLMVDQISEMRKQLNNQ